MWFKVFNVCFTCFFIKVKKTCFYVFYLKINVFNIYVWNRCYAAACHTADRRQTDGQTATHKAAELSNVPHTKYSTHKTSRGARVAHNSNNAAFARDNSDLCPFLCTQHRVVINYMYNSTLSLRSPTTAVRSTWESSTRTRTHFQSAYHRHRRNETFWRCSFCNRTRFRPFFLSYSLVYKNHCAPILKKMAANVLP